MTSSSDIAKAGLFSGPKKVREHPDRFNSMSRLTTKVIDACFKERSFVFCRSLGDIAAGRPARGPVKRKPIPFKEWGRSLGA